MKTNLAAALADFRKLSNERMEKTARASFVRLGTFIVNESPVDKGRFVANWNFAYGAADTSTKDGEFGGDSEKQGSINRLTTELASLGLDSVFYMSNSLPYALRLEYGHSLKSELFVTRGVAEWPRFFAEEVQKAKR